MSEANGRKWFTPSAVMALAMLLALLLAAVGFERKDAHDADILRLEKKLDCALWDLPVGCRQSMAPRSP